MHTIPSDGVRSRILKPLNGTVPAGRATLIDRASIREIPTSGPTGPMAGTGFELRIYRARTAISPPVIAILRRAARNSPLESGFSSFTCRARKNSVKCQARKEVT